MSMALAWITGAHGFIGRYLARGLQADGYQVAGIGHGVWPEAEAAQWGLSFWLNGEISASNLGQMRQILGLPDVVFHLAGGSSVGAAIAQPHEDFTRTVVSTAALLEWLRQHSPATRLVAVSSAAVYGSAHSCPIAEDARLSPFSPYGAHKLMMEELCRSYAANFGLRVVVPRLFSVYGPGLKKQLLWDFCGKVAAGGVIELCGSGNELRDWLDVRDVALGLGKVSQLASVQAPAINLASGVAMAVREIVALVMAQWTGSGVQSREVMFSGQSRPGDPFSLVADITQMRAYGIDNRILVTQGVGEYVAWYRTHTEAI
jgi:UDP-glucose 4-epimerase